MRSLERLTAVVTGASSGVGEGLALELAREGMKLRLIGRDSARLDAVVRRVRKLSPDTTGYRADLSVDDELDALQARLLRECDGVDVLVHSAAAIMSGNVADAPVADFDLQYRTNLRAPYLLTQTLLPMLLARRGQIVFVNSSVGLAARPGASQYAATKHGLRAVADALRAEINPQGVRVLSVYLGRTATPGQEKLHQQEGEIIRPGEIAADRGCGPCRDWRAEVGWSAEVTDISIRPMQKS